MIACIYQELIEKKTKIDIIQYVDSLSKNSFTHIAIFLKSSYFKENLEGKLNQINSNSKKTKI